VTRVTLVFFFLSTLVSAGHPAQQTGPDVNVVRSIRSVTVNSMKTIEIELHSSRPFPVRDQIVILRIGNTDIVRSRPPSDGSLNTLIFIMTPEDFDRLMDGAALSVRYGLEHSDEPAAPVGRDTVRWDFGTLNKSMLTR